MSFGKHSDDTIQIKINISGENIHFARIKRFLWNKLGEELKNTSYSDRTKWIKEVCKNEFGIELNTKDDLIQFDMLKLSYNYDDRNDWLRDKIRHYLEENRTNSL